MRRDLSERLVVLRDLLPPAGSARATLVSPCPPQRERRSGRIFGGAALGAGASSNRGSCLDASETVPLQESSALPLDPIFREPLRQPDVGVTAMGLILLDPAEVLSGNKPIAR